jgi:plasmid maintenance system antidote protein VapI
MKASDVLTLDLSRPIESLLELLEISQYALAEAANVTRGAVQMAARARAGIGIATLARYAASVGWELEVRLRRRGAGRG